MQKYFSKVEVCFFTTLPDPPPHSLAKDQTLSVFFGTLPLESESNIVMQKGGKSELALFNGPFPIVHWLTRLLPDSGGVLNPHPS